MNDVTRHRPRDLTTADIDRLRQRISGPINPITEQVGEELATEIGINSVWFSDQLVARGVGLITSVQLLLEVSCRVADGEDPWTVSQELLERVTVHERN